MSAAEEGLASIIERAIKAEEELTKAKKHHAWIRARLAHAETRLASALEEFDAVRAELREMVK